MNILALEGGGAQVALCALQLQDGSALPRAVALLPEARRLSQDWPAALQSTLQRADWTLDDVEALAVGLGPGSWTGLRIAVTAWKTLAQTRELPLSGVPTFDAFAQAAWRAQSEEDGADAEGETESVHRVILVCSPCRPGELYGKIFESDADYLMVAQDEWIGSEQMMVDALLTQALSRDIVAPPLVVGATPRLQQLLAEAGEDAILAEVPLEVACVEIALAGALRIQSNEADDALTLQPLYLAPSAAERNLTR